MHLMEDDVLRDTIFETNRMCFYRTTILSWKKEKKRKRERIRATELRGTSALSCWTVTTDYL